MSRSKALPTIRQSVDAVARRLRAARLVYGHGTFNAREEATWLVLHACRVSPSDFDEQGSRPVSAAEARRIETFVRRRIDARIPAAYLTKQAWLGEHSFYVDRRVIVPRSFIAELIPEGIELFLRRRVRDVLDLCTGSGCLAILLALAYREARIEGVDLSSGALAVARRNVTRYGLGSRIALKQSDLFSGLGMRSYDLIVSNPPYVKSASMDALPPEYRAEPKMALAGGTDGLLLVRKILAGAHERLRPRGSLVCEIGHNRAALERAYPRTPFTWLETSAGDRYVFVLSREELPALA